MKNSGLKNRFDNNVVHSWLFHCSCLLCDENGWDCLHHIISPSSDQYISGDFNRSKLNSCPLHNFKCHIGNEALLYKPETITLLLNKVYDALVNWQMVELDDRDKEFITKYKILYGDRLSKNTSIVL